MRLVHKSEESGTLAFFFDRSGYNDDVIHVSIFGHFVVSRRHGHCQEANGELGARLQSATGRRDTQARQKRGMFAFIVGHLFDFIARRQ